MSDDAVFSEVLELSLDPADFRAGLAEIRTEYLAFLKEVAEAGGSGADASNIGGIGAVTEQVAQLAQEMRAFTDSTAAALGGVAGALTTQVEAVTTKVSGLVSGAVEKTSTATGTIVETSQARMDRIFATIMAGTANQATLTQATWSEQLQIWIRIQDEIEAKGISVLDNLTVANRKNATDISIYLDEQVQAFLAAQQKEAIALNDSLDAELEAREKQAADTDAIQVKILQAFVELMQKREVEQATALGKELQMWERYAAELTAIDQKRAIEEATIRGESMARWQAQIDEQAAIQKKRDVEMASARGKQMMDEKAIQQQRDIQERDSAAASLKIEQDRAFAIDKLCLDIEAASKKSAEARVIADNSASDAVKRNAAATADAYAKLAEDIKVKAQALADDEIRLIVEVADRQIAETQRAATASERIMQSSIQKANQGPSETETGSGILGSLQNVAKFQLQWMLVGAAITAATEPLRLFNNFIKEGVTYTEELETRAAELQGVIATKVRFAGADADQFKLAGEAATNMARQIQDAAIQYHVSIDVLTRGFKSFVDNGGTYLTHGLDDALKVSNMLSVSLNAAGKDAQTTRALLGEIPGLLSGTAKANSLILTTLGISATKWKEIVTHAGTQKDLLVQLQPYMQKYLDVAGQAGDRFGAIKEELGIMYDRTAALAAQQFWPDLKGFLIEARQYLIDNADKIDACARAMGSFVDSIIRGVGQKSALDGLLATFQALAAGLIHTKYAAKGVVDGLRELALLKKLNDDTDVSPRDLQGGMNMNDYKARLKQDMLEIKQIWNDNKPDGGAAERDEIEKLYNPPPPPPPPVTPPVVGGAPPPKTAAELAAEAKEAAALQAKRLAEELAAYRQFLSDKAEERRKFGEVLKQQIAAGTLSAQDAARQEIGFNEALALSIAKVTQKYVELTEHKGKKNKADPSVQVTNEGTRATSAISDASAAADTTITKDDKQIIDDNTKFAIAEANKVAAEKIRIAKASGASQVAIVNMENQAALHAHEQEMTQLQALVKAQAAGSVARNTARNNEQAAITAWNFQLIQQHENLHKATLKDMETEAAQAEKTRQARITELEAKAARHTASMGPGEVDKEGPANAKAILELKKQSAELDILATKEMLKQAVLDGDDINTITALITKLETKLALLQKIEATQTAGPDMGVEGRIFGDNRSGQDKTDQKTAMSKGFDSFSDSTKSLLQGFKTFGNAASSIMQGVKSGGILGGIGAGASAIGGMIPGVAGQIVSGIGSAISMISGFFTAYAQHVADQIKKSFSDTVTALNDGQATLSQTLIAVQAERQQAINSLSGVKGGQDQLDKLLPQFDAEITQLKLQIASIVTNFQQALSVLQLNNSAAASFVQAWTAVNAQVKTYLDAGGDAAKAQQMLSDTLKTQLSAATDGYNSGYQTAIADAISLNDLLKQRVALILQEKQTEFGITSADALERRQSGAIAAGNALTVAKAAFAQQLKDLNNQITLTTEKLNIESTIYDINKSILDLHATDNAIQIAALNKQIQQAQAYKDIMNSISVNSAGQASLNPGFGVTIGSINISATTDSSLTAAGIGQTIANEIITAGRNGGPGYSKAIAPGQ